SLNDLSHFQYHHSVRIIGTLLSGTSTMTRTFRTEVSSSPCMLGEDNPDIIQHEPASQSTVLLNGLSRVFGIRLGENKDSSDVRFLNDLTCLFHQQRVDVDAQLEQHDTPWANVYL